MDLVMCNILIKALLMVGLFEDALDIYKGLPQIGLSPNSVSYCSLIDGYCKVGMISEALEIFDDFRRASNPPPAAYKRIVKGLCDEGLVDMAVDVFIEYMRKGMTLDRTMYFDVDRSNIEQKRCRWCFDNDLQNGRGFENHKLSVMMPFLSSVKLATRRHHTV